VFQYSGVARASRGGEVWRAIFGWLVVAGVGSWDGGEAMNGVLVLLSICLPHLS